VPFAIFVCRCTHSSLGVAEQIVLWLHREATSLHKSVGYVDIMIYRPQSFSLILLRHCFRAVSTGNFFTLLFWIGTVLDVSLGLNPTFKSTRTWEPSLQTTAALLDGLLNPATHAKSSLRQAAIVRLRRTFREVRQLSLASILSYTHLRTLGIYSTLLKPF